jgi:hypothetical protein
MIGVGDYIPDVGGAVFVAEFEAQGHTVHLHGHHDGDVILVAAPVDDWRAWTKAGTPVGYTQGGWYCGVATAWKILSGDNSVTWPGAHAIKVILIRKPH